MSNSDCSADVRGNESYVACRTAVEATLWRTQGLPPAPAEKTEKEFAFCPMQALCLPSVYPPCM